MSRADFEVFDKNAANYEPLTPLSFLIRTKDIYPNRQSVVYGNRRYTGLRPMSGACGCLLG